MNDSYITINSFSSLVPKIRTDNEISACWWSFVTVCTLVPAAVIKQGHLPLNSPPKQQQVDVILQIGSGGGKYQPLPAHIQPRCGAAAADTDSGRPPGRSLYIHLLDNNNNLLPLTYVLRAEGKIMSHCLCTERFIPGFILATSALQLKADCSTT